MVQLKDLPKVDKVLEWPGIRDALVAHPRPVVLTAVRSALDSLRARAVRGELHPDALAETRITELVLASLAAATAPSLKRVINGTGVVINTNLGRSPLAPSIRQHLEEIAFSYSNLEYDLETGERGSRYSHVESLLCELTGAEAALVVNNNAGAVLLALSSLADGREAIVSRGELVEIGGSFRISDVMRQSGAILREVGTTNRTHPRDYRDALTAETALFLKVHCSNFAIVGFTSEVSAADLVALGRESSIPVMADVGSGNLLRVDEIPLSAEPDVGEYVRAGVDVVTFSGDKLLGGPQAGLIVGRQKYIQLMKKHPLLRALRIDKMTLAALEGTLRLYRDPRQAMVEIPTLRMLAAKQDDLLRRGKAFLRKLHREIPAGFSFSVRSDFSQVGGGALPLVSLPTTVISVEMTGVPPHELDRRLRLGNPPVVGRVQRGTYLLDVRTIEDTELPLLVCALKGLKP